MAWKAYLRCTMTVYDDNDMAVEEGMGFIATGDTKEDAEAAVREKLRNSSSPPLSDTAMALWLEDSLLETKEI